MADLTFKQIDKYLSEQKYGYAVSVPCGELSPACTAITVNVKTTLTELEKKTFIDRIVDNSYINNINYSPINKKITFVVTFAQMFTNLPIPTKENDPESIDVDKLYSMVVGLNLIENARETNKFINKLLSELEMCIKQEIDFKNQKLVALYSASSASNDAIETVSYLANRTLDGVNKACDILDNANDLIQDGKFLKIIPKKKLDDIFAWIQKIINDISDNSK